MEMATEAFPLLSRRYVVQSFALKEELRMEIRNNYEMEKQDILDMVKYARHIHVAGEGNNIDTCKKCGHDIRHGIHFRYGENINEYTKDKAV